MSTLDATEEMLGAPVAEEALPEQSPDARATAVNDPCEWLFPAMHELIKNT